jgi:small subunit ribosomal protein S18
MYNAKPQGFSGSNKGGYRKKSRKRCYFTDNKVEYRVTGTKAYYQKHLAVAIKRARYMALLPFVKE